MASLSPAHLSRPQAGDGPVSTPSRFSGRATRIASPNPGRGTRPWARAAPIRVRLLHPWYRRRRAPALLIQMHHP